MRWCAYILMLLVPVLAFGKVPVGLKKWQLDDTTFSKQIGGAVRNYEKPDKAWAEIVNDFEIEGDSVVYVDKAVLRARVNKGTGVSTVFLTWGGQEYTVTQKPVGIGWLKISTRQSQWIDSTMNWGSFSVDSNICKWTGISPAVDYRVLKDNGRVAHGIFYKPAFLDSAVVLYNQREDSLDIALANVMVYTLSANIDDADSAMGELPWRRLKDFGYYSFNLGKQRLRFPGCDTLPRIPVRQYWERRGTKIICIEYVMMSHVKKVHEAYPNAVIWHNDTKKIEGTTNVEDATIDQYNADYSYGGSTYLKTYTWDVWGQAIFIRVKGVARELGPAATISSCVCSLYCYDNEVDGVIDAYSVFKPWVEGDDGGADNDDGDVTHNDFQSDALEFGTEGCECARDNGVDNSNDDGDCTDANADRKATAESSTDVTSTGWWPWSVTSALAQAWYDGTKNEEGIFLLNEDGDNNNNDFYSTESAEAEKPFWVFTYTSLGCAFTGTSHVMDSWMQSGIQAGTNYGAETYITFHNNFGTEMRPIIKVIDIADSVEAPIVACSLCLWQSLGTSGKTGTLYAVKKDTWTEDGVCWDDWKTDYQWGTGGANSTSDDAGCNTGDGSGADRTTTSVGSITTPGTDNWICVAIDTDLAADWLNGTECTSGVVIAVAEGANNLRFHSSEGDSVPRWIFVWEEEEEAVGTVRYVQGPGGARVVQSAEGASEVQGP